MFLSFTAAGASCARTLRSSCAKRTACLRAARHASAQTACGLSMHTPPGASRARCMRNCLPHEGACCTPSQAKTEFAGRTEPRCGSAVTTVCTNSVCVERIGATHDILARARTRAIPRRGTTRAWAERPPHLRRRKPPLSDAAAGENGARRPRLGYVCTTPHPLRAHGAAARGHSVEMILLATERTRH